MEEGTTGGVECMRVRGTIRGEGVHRAVATGTVGPVSTGPLSRRGWGRGPL